jgi:hypothetical protein
MFKAQLKAENMQNDQKVITIECKHLLVDEICQLFLLFLAFWGFWSNVESIKKLMHEGFEKYRT